MAQEQVSRKICSNAHNRVLCSAREKPGYRQKRKQKGGVGWKTTDLSNYSS